MDTVDFHLPLGRFPLIFRKLFCGGQAFVLALQLVHLPGGRYAHALFHGQLFKVGLVFHPAVLHSIGQCFQVVCIHAVGFMQGLHQASHLGAALQNLCGPLHCLLHQLLGLSPVLALQQRMERLFVLLRRHLGLFFGLAAVALSRVSTIFRSRQGPLFFVCVSLSGLVPFPILPRAPLSRGAVSAIALTDRFFPAGCSSVRAQARSPGARPFQHSAAPGKPLLRRAHGRFHNAAAALGPGISGAAAVSAVTKKL